MTAACSFPPHYEILRVARHTTPSFTIENAAIRMSTIPQYQYSPIDTNERKLYLGRSRIIRLLNILPGAFGDDLCVTIEAGRLNLVNPPQYEALSYVWGSGQDLKTIYIGGDKQFSLQVTQNLESSLRHLRHSDNNRVLWVDAICINQSDNNERNEEVFHMRDIYACASRVIIWLGAKFECCTSPDNEEHGKRVMSYIQETSISEKAFDQLENPGEISSALAWLYHRPWFQRVWILQELIMCPPHETLQDMPNAVFHLGKWEVPFFLLWQTIDKLKRDHASSIVNTTWRHHQAIALLNTPILVLRNAWCDYRGMGSDLPLESRSPAEQLLFMLVLVTWRDCTVMHDIFYGVLGLVQGSIPATLLPDYASDEESVFRTYASYLLSNTQCPWILECSSFVNDWSPSWVPDWRGGSLKMFADHRGPVVMSSDGRKIGVEGIYLDKVAAVAMNWYAITQEVDCVQETDIYGG